MSKKLPHIYLPSIPVSMAENDVVTYDTEFMENGGFKPVELVSIGLVRKSDGATYYAVSTQFNAKHANAFVKQNVLPKLPPRNKANPVYDVSGFQEERVWKDRGQIAIDLKAFCGYQPRMWAYYGAYDHVCLSQLFGAMIHLPNEWPMWNRDIKMLCWLLGNPQLPRIENDGHEHDALYDAKRAMIHLDILNDLWKEKYGTDISRM